MLKGIHEIGNPYIRHLDLVTSFSSFGNWYHKWCRELYLFSHKRQGTSLKLKLRCMWYTPFLLDLLYMNLLYLKKTFLFLKLTWQEVLIFLISGIHHHVMTCSIEQLMLFNQVQIVPDLSIDTKDEPAKQRLDITIKVLLTLERLWCLRGQVQLNSYFEFIYSFI